MADQYDEFGNYIGSELSGSEYDYSEEESGAAAQPGAHSDVDEFMDGDKGASGSAPTHTAEGIERVVTTDASAVVPFERRDYYGDNESLFAGADYSVQLEDEQDIKESIIAPEKSAASALTLVEETPLPLRVSGDYLARLVAGDKKHRVVAVCGDLHSGKTSVCDMLFSSACDGTDVDETIPDGKSVPRGSLKPGEGVRVMEVKGRNRYTDTRKDEQEREMSVKITPFTLGLVTEEGTTLAVTAVDSPGHSNFGAEVAAAVRLADSVMLVVDALEGVREAGREIIRVAVGYRKPILLLINKMDRLPLEARMPPKDAYYKLERIVDSVNAEITLAVAGNETLFHSLKVDPVHGNVLFSSALHNWCTSVNAWAKYYANDFNKDPDHLRKRLWGDSYFNAESKKFQKRPQRQGDLRSFVQFVLEPLWKIHTVALSETPKTLAHILSSNLDINLDRHILSQDPKPLLSAVLREFFVSGAAPMVSAMARHLPSPKEAAVERLTHTFLGPQPSTSVEEGASPSLSACDPTGPLYVEVLKLLTTPTNVVDFVAVARVISGRLEPGMKVEVLGDEFSPLNPEDSSQATVTKICLPHARFETTLMSAPAGALVLVYGVHKNMRGGAAALVKVGCEDDIRHTVRALAGVPKAVVKVGIEPLRPRETPKLTLALQRVAMSYPALVCTTEESGERVLIGAGEVHLNAVLHDIRCLFSSVEVRISDPVVPFAETVSSTSGIKCLALTANKMSGIHIVAEPLDEGLDVRLEAGALDLQKASGKEVRQFFMENYGWDSMAARGIWAFGPSATAGPNVLVNDVLAGTVDRQALRDSRESIVQGFQWACSEGPLAEGEVRGVKFKVVGTDLCDEPIRRGNNQLVPAARRVVYSSMMSAEPRLMEPWYQLEITTPYSCIDRVHQILGRRRGHAEKEVEIPGTPLYSVRGYLPVVESFGLETDLRVATEGSAMLLSRFDRWEQVPGNPLDTSIEVVTNPGDRSEAFMLAREFTVKTRRRKGLNPEFSVYINDDELERATNGSEAANAAGITVL